MWKRFRVAAVCLLALGAVASAYKAPPYRGRIAIVNKQFITGVVRLVGPSCDMTVKVPGGRRVVVRGLESGTYIAYADFNADGEYTGWVEFVLERRNKVTLTP